MTKYKPNCITIGGWWQSAVALCVTVLVIHAAGRQIIAPDIGEVDLSLIESGNINHNNYYAQVSGYADETTAQSQRRLNIPLIHVPIDTALVYIPLHQQTNSRGEVSLIIAVQEDQIEKYIQVNPATNKLTVKGHVTSIMATDVKKWLLNNGVFITNDTKYINPSVDREGSIAVGLIFGGLGMGATIGLFKRRTIRW
ncbi:hypothetical protein [Chamaesiphon sp. GL140_3_metabinner_50]|uniref:hypothetical protein n=1 Tax=Chamaesiphon sp. GL140_3_metabinner_50 TaxID=2970812 RepID=UPI0025D79269|nr:hypothetical protein [Chamaesiphon sp. GL140_3_metabinner_50]